MNVGLAADNPQGLWGLFHSVAEAETASAGAQADFTILGTSGTVWIAVVDGQCGDNSGTVQLRIDRLTANSHDDRQAQKESSDPTNPGTDANDPGLDDTQDGHSGEKEGRSEVASQDPNQKNQSAPTLVDDPCAKPNRINDAAGDPVDLFSGQLLHRQIDLGCPAVGGGLAFMRSYVSGSPRTGAFGPGWSHSYERSVVDLQAQGAKEIDGRGAVLVFPSDGQGGYTAPAGGGASMARDANSGWTVTYATGRTYRYRPDGKLDYIRDANGLTTQLQYATDGSLQKVTGPSGRYLDFTVVNGRITSVESDAGSRVQYAYDALGRLAVHTNSRNSVTSISYLLDTSNVVRLDLPSGDIAEYTYTYDGVYRVTSIKLTATDGTQSISQIVYEPNFVRHFIDPKNRDTKYEFNSMRNLVKVTRPGGLISSLTWSSASKLLSETDPDGLSRSWSYSSDGKLLSHTTRGGRVTQVLRDPSTGFPVTLILPDGSPVQRTYDIAGNLTSITDALMRQTTFVRNSQGQVTSVTDPGGRITTYAYDAVGSLITKTDPASQITQYQRDSMARLSSITTPGGRITQLEYVGAGTILAAVTDATNNRTAYEIDTLGRTTAIVRPNGARTEFTYSRINGRNCIVSIKDALGNITEAQYDVSGDLTAVLDPLLRKTQFTRDPLGRLSRIDYPDGNYMLLTRNLAGDVTSVENGRAARTSFTYNADHEPTVIQYPDSSSVTLTYDDRGRVLTRIHPDGGVQLFEWDSVGQLKATTSPEGRTTKYEYTPTGRPSRLIDPRLKVTQVEYDELDRPFKVTDPLNRARQIEYWPDGERKKTINARSAATNYTYDSLSRPTQVTDALGHTVNIAYDSVGNMTSLTNQNGKTWVYTYDLLSRLATETDPNGKITTYAYNAASELTVKTFPDGSRWEFDRDLAGRVTHRRLYRSDGTLEDTEAFTFDVVGNRLTAANASFKMISTYDPMNRESHRRNLFYKNSADPLAPPFEKDLQFFYDAMGRRSRLYQPEMTRDTTYFYDRDSRLTRMHVTDFVTMLNPARDFTFAWDPSSNLVQVDYPNKTRTRRTFDDVNRLASVVHETQPSTQLPWLTLGAQSYTRDEEGNVTTLQTDRPLESFQYSYDLRDQLKHATVPLPLVLRPPTLPAPTEQEAELRLQGADVDYAYDPAGNRTREAYTLQQLLGTQVINSTFGAANELLSRGGVTYTYDARGNQLEKLYPTGNRQLRTFDVAGRLTQFATQASGSTASTAIERYAYDPMSHRIQLEDTQSSTRTFFVWDNNAVVDEFFRFTDIGAPNPVLGLESEKGHLYVNGPNSDVLEQFPYYLTYRFLALPDLSSSPPFEPTRDPVTIVQDLRHLRFMHRDNLWSTSLISDAVGTYVSRYLYGPWGEDLAGSNFKLTRFTYAGTQRDTPSSLQYMHHRWYDAASGRFVSKDPIGFAGGLNLYAYASNNPVSLRDPLGLAPGDPFTTPEQAAMDAANYYYTITTTAGIDVQRDGWPYRGGVELGGWIYQIDGSYTYQVAVEGTKSGVDPYYYIPAPVGAQYWGSYHTHGPETPGRDNEYPSDKDEIGCDNVFKKRGRPYYGILITPKGAVSMYVPRGLPGGGQSYPIGTVTK